MQGDLRVSPHIYRRSPHLLLQGAVMRQSSYRSRRAWPQGSDSRRNGKPCGGLHKGAGRLEVEDGSVVVVSLEGEAAAGIPGAIGHIRSLCLISN